jgi:hypothetical protein
VGPTEGANDGMSEGASLLICMLGDPDEGGTIDGGPEDGELSVGDPGVGVPFVGGPGEGVPFVGGPGEGVPLVGDPGDGAGIDVGEAGAAVSNDRNEVESSFMKRRDQKASSSMNASLSCSCLLNSKSVSSIYNKQR